MTKKLAVFDIDGTIAQKGIFDPAALKGLQHLQRLGYYTTVSTGRGYASVKYALGELFDTVIADGALILLDQGTRICSKNGETLFAERLSDDEITSITDFIRTNSGLVQFVYYNPEGADRKQQLWAEEQGIVDTEIERRRAFAEGWSGSIGELRDKLLTEGVTQVECRLKSHIVVQNLKLGLAHSPLTILFQDQNMSLMKNNVNKGLAILYAMKELGVEYEDLIVAGNAVNDIEMLDLDAGKRILVGPKDERETVLGYLSRTEAVVQVPSPTHLGLYLQKL